METRNFYINKLQEILSNPCINQDVYKNNMIQSQYMTVEKIIETADAYLDYIDRVENENT